MSSHAFHGNSTRSRGVHPCLSSHGNLTQSPLRSAHMHALRHIGYTLWTAQLSPSRSAQMVLVPHTSLAVTKKCYILCHFSLHLVIVQVL